MKTFDLQRPFYSFESKWAAGGSLKEISQVEKLYDQGVESNTYQHDKNRYNLFLGLSKGLVGDYASRWYIGFSKEEDYFEEVDDTVSEIPTNRLLIYPWLAYELVENRFAIYQNLNLIETTEDVSLGKRFYVKLGYGGSSLDNEVPKWRFFSNYSDVYLLGERHLFFLETHLDGAWNVHTTHSDNTVFGMSVSYLHLISDRHRWFVGIKADMGSHLYEDTKLNLEDEFGMRGYPTGYENGNRRLLFSLERRYYSPLHILHLFRLGGVAFFDAGRAWQTSAPNESPVLYDIGIGLRLLSSKARTGNVLHLDVVMPLTARDNIDSVQWIVKSYTSF